MTLDNIMDKVRELSEEDRIRLVDIINDMLNKEKVGKRSILDFRGIAAHLADDEDPQAYISRLRDEWDEDDPT